MCGGRAASVRVRREAEPNTPDRPACRRFVPAPARVPARIDLRAGRREAVADQPSWSLRSLETPMPDVSMRRRRGTLSAKTLRGFNRPSVRARSCLLRPTHRSSPNPYRVESSSSPRDHRGTRRTPGRSRGQSQCDVATRRQCPEAEVVVSSGRVEVLPARSGSGWDQASLRARRSCPIEHQLPPSEPTATWNTIPCARRPRGSQSMRAMSATVC